MNRSRGRARRRAVPGSWAAGAIGIALCLSGCGKSIDDLYGKETTSATHDEAATTHVAVLSVAPWTEVAGSLQPSFKLSTADALTQAIPTTQAIEEKLVEAFMAKIGIGLPSTSSAATETLTQSSVVTQAVDAAGTATDTQQSSREETSTETDTKAPGQVPTPTLPSGVPSALGLPGIGVADEKIGDDPFLRYGAATALFQEAALLDQYVKNAAKRTGYVPYLVRMQLSVLAHKRNQPYDIYADMSFFLQQQVASSAKIPAVRRAEELRAAADRAKAQEEKAEKAVTDLQGKTVSEEVKSEAASLVEAAKKNAEAAKRVAEDAEKLADQAVLDTGIDLAACQQEVALGNLPEVIPLLVTDNIEAALRSKAIDKLSQFALALNLMIKGVGANIDTSASNEDFAALIGKDLNSLFTVAKMSGNTMRARIGALNQVETRYAAMSRTHNLSLLVMIPKSYAEKCDPTLTILAQTAMRHVRTGAEIQPIESDKFYQRIHDLYRDWYPDLGKCIDPNDEANKKIELAMDDAVLEGDYAAFTAAIRKGVETSQSKECPPSKFDDEFYAHAGLGYLWQDILAVLQSYGISQVSFSVPYKKDSQAALPPTQTALLLDNGTTAAVRLQGAGQTDASVMSAGLQRRRSDSTEQILVAQGVARDGSALVAQFPSPALWKVRLEPEKVKDAAGNESIPDPFKLYLAVWNNSVTPPECDAAVVRRGTLDGKKDQIIGACYEVSALTKKEDVQPKVAIIQSATTIVGDTNAMGRVSFGVEAPEGAKFVKLSVLNAELTDAAIFKEIALPADSRLIQATFDLRNLDMDKNVMVTAEALKPDKTPMAKTTATFQVKLPEAKKKAE